jgi:hypothetical protein
MPTIYTKVKTSLYQDGVLKTAYKIIKYPFSILKYKHFTKNVLVSKSIEDRFTWIYKNNHWEDEESISGKGSTLQYTENLRKQIPTLLSSFSISKIFDAPCGDFNWMAHLLPTINVEYIGGDIVRPLIDEHNKKYKNSRREFIHINLIEDTFPKADLMICRDCLFHLSFEDTKSVLNNFVNSDIKYLLTTTHINTNEFSNKNIRTGDFRLIDLFSAPYNFPLNPLVTIEDWIAPDPERQMCLWSREQISVALARFILN